MLKVTLAGFLALSALGCLATGGPLTPTSLLRPGGAPAKQGVQESLQDPQSLNAQAPATFRARFETTQGDFTMEFYREWSPNGVDRFYNLVKAGYYKDIAVFRAIDNFMFQFGIHGDPALNKIWSEARIKDDPKAGHSNEPGTISFAMGGPNSRTTQLFINLADNRRLDGMGFTPLGKVIENAGVLGKINTEYGENDPDVQGKFQAQGNAFIKEKYPNLDYIKSISLVDE